MAKPEEVEEADDYKCRGGRPPKTIDAEQLRKMRALQMTEEEIAAVFNVSTRTLARRIKVEPWKGAWELGRSEGHASLRRLQWQHAQMPNSAGVAMTIHLSKHWLGETDKAALELTGKDGGPIEVSTARERVHAKLDNIAERIKSRVAGIAAAAGATKLPAGTE